MENHRKLCNKVKKIILRKAYKNVNKDNNKIKLVDLCCGRGGDLFKWNSIIIDNVLAIDNHKESVDEAINRYNNGNFIFDVDFVVDDSINICNYVVDGTINIVSCNFALHYFDKKDLISLIVSISNILNKGGYFIGTCMDGDIVRDMLDTGKKIDNVNLVDYGDMYGVKLYYLNEYNGTKSYFDYRKDFDYSKEYFIEKKVLIELCNSNGLKLGEMNNLGKSWKGNHISNMYFSFMFVKL